MLKARWIFRQYFDASLEDIDRAWVIQRFWEIRRKIKLAWYYKTSRWHPNNRCITHIRPFEYSCHAPWKRPFK